MKEYWIRTEIHAFIDFLSSNVFQLKSFELEGRGYCRKFFTGSACPEVQPLNLLYTLFGQKSYHFSMPFIMKKVPL